MPPDGERPTDHDDDGADGRLLAHLAHLRHHPVELIEPPAFLYARIETELRITTVTTVTPAPSAISSLDTAREARVARRARSRPATWLAAAAAVVVVGGVGAISTVQRDDPPPIALASAQLRPVAYDTAGQHPSQFRGAEPPTAAASTGEGYAVVIDDDGQRKLKVVAKGLPAAPEGHHVELWVTDRDSVGSHDLGRLPSPAALAGGSTVDLPSTIDLEQLPVVELTFEDSDRTAGPSSLRLLAGELP